MRPSLPQHKHQGYGPTPKAQRAAVALLLVVTSLMAWPPTGLFAAVDLQSFTAQGTAGGIVVTWKTATEVHNLGFRLLRSTSSGGTYEDKGVFASTCPGCIEGQSYSFTDSAITPGQTYFYKLQAVDTGRQYGPISAKAAVQSATATRTSVPVATTARTATPLAAAIASPTNTPGSVIRTPTRSASPTTSMLSRSGASVPTPATKIARALNANPSTPVKGAPDALALRTPIPTEEEQRLQVESPDDISDDTTETEATLHQEHVSANLWIGVVSWGLACLFGIGSIICAAFASVLLIRSLPRS